MNERKEMGLKIILTCQRNEIEVNVAIYRVNCTLTSRKTHENNWKLLLLTHKCTYVTAPVSIQKYFRKWDSITILLDTNQ